MHHPSATAATRTGLAATSTAPRAVAGETAAGLGTSMLHQGQHPQAAQASMHWHLQPAMPQWPTATQQGHSVECLEMHVQEAQVGTHFGEHELRQHVSLSLGDGSMEAQAKACSAKQG